MIYIVELEFTDPPRRHMWDAWYLERMSVLLTVPGIRSAQRFECMTPFRAPLMAMYSIDSGEVFDSDPYRNKGGRESVGEWRSTMSNWDRNLFDGAERAPAVEDGQLLLVTESAPATEHCDIVFTRLQCVGLDRTVSARWIAVASAAVGRVIDTDSNGRIRPYRPVTRRYTDYDKPAGIDHR